MRNNKNNVICRPCKEENSWEIQEPDGSVSSKHYMTKEECVKQGRRLAEEYSADLIIEDLKDADKATKAAHRKNNNTRGK